MYERVKAAKLIDDIVIATTKDVSDNKVEELCKLENIKYFRGNTEDLLDRHFEAAVNFGATDLVKIPSDCPLIDPGVIDKVLQFYISNKNKYDYVSNLHPATFPDGNDVEVMPIKTLEIAFNESTLQMEREHMTPYIWENPHRFRLGNVKWESGDDYSMTHRFTIDYYEDYLFIKRIYEELYNKNKLFTLKDILKLLKEKPEIMEINKKYAGVNWYSKHLNDLKTITINQTKIINE